MESKKEAASNPASGSSVSSSSFQYPHGSGSGHLLGESVGLSDDNGDKSRNGVRSTVSEDEDYLSGEEEFQMALDKPVLDEAVGEDVRDGGFEVEAVSGVGLGDGGGGGGGVGVGVGKGGKDVEGCKSVVEGNSEAGLGADDGEEGEGEVGGQGSFDGKGEIVDLNEGVVESVDEIGGNVTVQRVEMNGNKSEEEEKEGDVVLLSEPLEKVVSEVVAERVEKRGEDNEGIDGLVNIEDEFSEPQEKVVSEVEAEKVEVRGEVSEKEGESGSRFVGDEFSEPQEKVVSEVVAVEQEESQSRGTADVNVMPAGDAVIDTIQVDVVHPGVVVVGETEENGPVANKRKERDIPEVVVATSATDLLKSENDGEEEVGTKTVRVYDQISESAAQNTVDVGKFKVLQSEDSVVGIEEDEKSEGGATFGLVNGVHTSITSNDSLSRGEDDNLRKLESDYEPAPVSRGFENDITVNANAIADGDSGGPIQINGEHASRHVQNNGLADGASEESERTVVAEPKADPKEIREVEDEVDRVHLEDYMSDGGADAIFGGSEAGKEFIEQLERESAGGSHTGGDSSIEQSQTVDGQIVTDSEEEGDTDDGGDGKELFDSAALQALLRAATGGDSGSNITITSQDGSRLFTVERPAGLGSSLQSLRPAPRPNRPNFFSASTPTVGGESEDNLSEEEKKKLEKLQQIRVKFLRLVHRLNLSPDESVAAQVLYRLALLGGRQGSQTFSLDSAKNIALQMEQEEGNDLDFSVNILVIGKSGAGKSATINSLFGAEKASIHAFETGTASAQQISGIIDGVKVQVIDTPGLKSSLVEQGFNRRALSSVNKFTKKSPLDVVLYVDRLDAQSRDLNDLPLLKTVTSALGSSIWRNAIVTLTHAASAPPDGPSGAPLSYEVYVSQRSHVVQQSIGHAVGDLRMMSPSLMNPVSLVENHPSCRKNREGQKILPNGQSWRPQLLLLCYAMKILSEASSVVKQQDPFDHRKLFGFRARSPPLPYMLSSMLQSRSHPKLPSDQGGDNADSDIDLDDLSDSDQEEEDEYDRLPPFKPLKKSQVAKLSREQKKAYFEEYDYRVKLLQEKQWKEEIRRMREIKKKGKDTTADYGVPEDDADPGAAAPVAVPLPDMALPPSFDSDNPAYRYRFLEPVSSFLARPVLDSHGWDHDCGYDGVNLEHSLAIANRFPVAYTIQITKDKKDFSISLDSSTSAKLGDKISSMAGFDVQAIGKQLAYILRAETKFKNLKRHKAAAGVSFTFLGENVVPGIKVEDQISLGKQYTLVGSAGAVRSQHDTAYGANFELQRREVDYPIGQVQSTLSLSVIKWRGDLALGFNSLAQFSIGRNSKVAVRAGINNKLSGQVTVRTSSSEHLSLALAAIIPTALSIYRKLCPVASNDKYSIY